MTEKLWGGRFKKPFDEDAKTLSFSLHIDKRLYSYDLRTNSAYAHALCEAGILTQAEYARLKQCLSDLHTRFEHEGDSIFLNDEDIHSCIERLVTAELGDLGKKLHTGKSRNDQVITDVRLYLKEVVIETQNKLQTLLKTLYKLAEDHQSTLFPGFTHFQTAQPILLAHHFLAYFEQFKRDLERFQENVKRVDVLPLGSGALSGNSYPIDRYLIAQELGFSALSQNSMDAVSDRDFMIEFCTNASLTMLHLSRFCEELVLWSSPLIGFIEISDAFTTGSSLMPQKKNPDIAELIRGKTGAMLGHVVGLSQLIKALPLTYNRDLQEDKAMLFESADTLLLCLTCFEKMIKEVTFQKEAIQNALKKGYILATDFADYLVKKSIPFRESHDITGKVVLYAIEQNKQLEELTLPEFQAISPVIQEDVFEVFNLMDAVNRKNSIGGTAKNQIHAQLNRIKESFKW